VRYWSERFSSMPALAQAFVARLSLSASLSVKEQCRGVMLFVRCTDDWGVKLVEENQ
jgi:hypothetical protein